MKYLLQIKVICFTALVKDMNAVVPIISYKNISIFGHSNIIRYEWKPSNHWDKLSVQSEYFFITFWLPPSRGHSSSSLRVLNSCWTSMVKWLLHSLWMIVWLRTERKKASKWMLGLANLVPGPSMGLSDFNSVVFLKLCLIFRLREVLASTSNTRQESWV